MAQPSETAPNVESPTESNDIGLAMAIFAKMDEEIDITAEKEIEDIDIEPEEDLASYLDSDAEDTATYSDTRSPGPTSGVRPRGDLPSLASFLRNAKPGDVIPPEANGIVIDDRLPPTHVDESLRSRSIRIWITTSNDPGSAFAVVTSPYEQIGTVKKLIEREHPLHPAVDEQRFGKTRERFLHVHNWELVRNVVGPLSTHLPDTSTEQQETGVWVLKTDWQEDEKEKEEEEGKRVAGGNEGSRVVLGSWICYLVFGVVLAIIIEVMVRKMMK